MSSPVEDACHRFEGLLSRLKHVSKVSAYSIPYLQFDNFAVYSDPERAKLDSDCNLVLRLKFVVHDPLHEATLAYTGVANDD